MRGQANGVEDRRPRGDDHEADDDEDEEEEEEGRHRGQGPPQQRRNQAQRPSSGPQQQQQQQQPRPQPPLTRNVGYVGKHRLSAAIARLDQELQSLQEELDELETMESASAACQEVITSTEGKPDPLLPITSGPENSSWDRWFQRVRSRSNKWWASKGSDFS
ncbi:guanine nucleotide-binding protein subunit gamma 2-like [Miscanthus floridulus]|uniref:guanine nucleotide-binding protein subunit gamma 2-like n=1 Tax=Miscanthus floridulus TaxID=154761 RepID=UPI00345878E2